MSKEFEAIIKMKCDCTESKEVNHRVYTETPNISDFNQEIIFFYVCNKCEKETSD
jgi:hypothetical protein